MKVSIFYFSGTGNTLYTVERFAHHLSDRFETELFSIENEIDKKEFYEAEIIFLAYPIYMSDMPLNMKKFVDELPNQNKSIGTICTQAVFSGDGAFVSHRKLTEKGYSHTWSMQVNAFTNIGLMGMKPPQNYKENVAVLERIDNEMKLLADKVYARKTFLTDKGFGKYILGNFQRPFYNMSIKSIRKKLNVNMETCNECGLCVDICPSKAIELDEGINFINREQCLGCLRCLNFCPTNSISRSKKPTKLQFKGPTLEVFKNMIANKKGEV